LQEVPQRGIHDLTREGGIPGDIDPERPVLVQAQVAGELPAHEGEWSGHPRPRLLDLLDGMRGFELHPIHAGHLSVGLEALKAVLQAAVDGVARSIGP
jgi:hypothetical protein